MMGFRLDVYAPQGAASRVQVCEVWRDGVLLAEVFLHPRGLRVVSPYIDERPDLVSYNAEQLRGGRSVVVNVLREGS